MYASAAGGPSLPAMTSADTRHVDTGELRSQLHGDLIEPGEGEYDRARTIFYGGFDVRPAAVAFVSDVGDVQRTIAFARDTGLPLAVRSGGHSVAGHGVVDGGIVLDLRRLKALDLEPDKRLAWAETGLTAGEYTVAAGAHGLATGFGDTASVGLGGLTLGGGVGYLVRKYGLTIDNLIAAEVVTASGDLVRADADTEPDLFWAIRGGGGNFGVATRFCLRLADVGEFGGGMLVLPATAEALAGVVREAQAAPEELSAIVNVLPCPPLPFVPAEHHGQPVIMAMLAWVGPWDSGERAVAPFRALATPLADLVRPMRYPEMYPPEGPEYHPKAVSRTMFVSRFDRADAEAIVDRIATSDAPMRAAQIRVLGGAMSRVPVDATAFAHRKSPIMINVAAFYDGPDRPAREAWVAELSGDLMQDDEGAYVGFLGAEGSDRVRAAYPGPTWDRLVEVKTRFDPENLFRSNQNVPPR